MVTSLGSRYFQLKNVRVYSPDKDHPLHISDTPFYANDVPANKDLFRKKFFLLRFENKSLATNFLFGVTTTGKLYYLNYYIEKPIL